MAAAVLGLGVFAVLFEALFLDQCLLSLDNRMFPPYRVHWPEDGEARSMNVLTSDINGFVMPEALVQLERWKDGELPLWNDRQNVGQPLLADMGYVGLYPTALLFLLMDPLRAFAWSMAVHVFAIGMGAFFLFRRWGQAPSSALLGAVVLAFCAFISNHVHIPNFVRVAGLACPGSGWPRIV